MVLFWKIANYFMLASTVSSKMVKHMADVEGFQFEETLTGFKWLGNKAIALRQQGFQVLFAFEEAIGFMVGNIVPDKDGVSALAVLAELCIQLEREQTTLSGYLDRLYEKYGYFTTLNSYFICHEAATIKKIFANIRKTDDKVRVQREFYFPD
jgi:phosphomannomutase